MDTNRHVQAYHCTVPLCVRLCILCFLSSFCLVLFCVSFDFAVHQYVLVSKLGLWLSMVEAGYHPARTPPPSHPCLSKRKTPKDHDWDRCWQLQVSATNRPSFPTPPPSPGDMYSIGS